MHCWLDPLPAEPLAAADDDFVDSQESARQELLDHQAEQVRRRHPALRLESRLVHKDPIPALRAESKDASVLVVGSRRLSEWQRTWLGSVSHALVLDLSGPIVVVGPETLVPT